MKKINYNRELCDFCGTCVSVCPQDAIELSENNLEITDKCTVCMNCVYICPLRALEVKNEG
ncbi:MAG TPA: 4Fe-4S binding protein [bacterium]|nr:4Fe-4S binding protein [bacterium]HPN42069.1 4Fe-4S binding protein [bacterium]